MIFFYLITEFHRALCCSNPKMSQIKTSMPDGASAFLKKKSAYKIPQPCNIQWES